MKPIVPLTREQARNTLAHKFTSRVDRLRQLGVKLGVRPNRVFLVWAKYTGSEYGEGNREEVARVEILPSPVVDSLDNIALHPMSAGMVPMGSVRLTKVSGQLTYDQLRGLMVPGRHEDHIPSPYEFFYEIYEDGRGDSEPVRSKFRLLGLPGRRAGKVDWTLTLERVSGDNDRVGEDTYGQ